MKPEAVEQGIPLAIFDFVVLAVLVAGLLRGRKRGMSQELVDFFMWLGIVFGGCYASLYGGAYLNKVAGLSQLWANIVSYLGAALVIFVVFLMIKNAVKDKMAGSDFFGRLEYPLGMLSGMTRFFCMLFVVLSLINAKLITAEERAKTAKLQQENFGSISFPTLGEIQVGIFEQSFSGKYIKQYLGRFLIQSGSAVGEDLGKKESIGRQRERELDKVIK